MNLYLCVRVEDLVEALVLLDALAVALGAADHQDVAALRQHLEDPLAPVLARLGEVGVDEDVVVDTGLATRGDAIRNRHDAGLVGARERRQDRLAGVREDDERVDALRDHPLDVGDRLLRVALAVGVAERRHARALARLVARRSGRHETPAVASEPVGQAERDLLRAAPRRHGGRLRGRLRLRGRRRHGDEHDNGTQERKHEKRSPSSCGHRTCPPFLSMIVHAPA